ncbi:hypothetical protein ACFX1S_023018 [Malus domestica]
MCYCSSSNLKFHGKNKVDYHPTVSTAFCFFFRIDSEHFTIFARVAISSFNGADPFLNKQMEILRKMNLSKMRQAAKMQKAK